MAIRPAFILIYVYLNWILNYISNMGILPNITLIGIRLCILKWRLHVYVCVCVRVRVCVSVCVCVRVCVFTVSMFAFCMRFALRYTKRIRSHELWKQVTRKIKMLKKHMTFRWRERRWWLYVVRYLTSRRKKAQTYKKAQILDTTYF